MDPQSQWQAYPDSAAASRRHNGNGNGPQIPRDYSSQPPAPGYKYDQYHNGAPVNAATTAASPINNPQMRDNNGDIPMQDAQDAHAGIKYPMRPHHQSHLSGSRNSTLHSPQEPSAAAQRYSPMETLSPTSPYAKTAGSGPYGNPPSQRQSPTRQADYSQSSYYAGRQQPPQLPPINPYASAHDSYPSSAVSALDGFANDPTSPRRPVPTMAVVKGPVPEFKKVRAPTDLRPKVNTQPPFRRANPEGGFISVSLLPICYPCSLG